MRRRAPARVPFFVFLFSWISFSVSASSRTDSALKERGVSALATILDGHSKTTQSVRRGARTDHTVRLSFKLQEGGVRVFATLRRKDQGARSAQRAW